MDTAKNARIEALAISLPRTVRTNDDLRAQHPDIVRAMTDKSLARLFSTSQRATDDASLFDREMEPHLRDPFRGSVERRVLLPGERSLDHEARACRSAMAALGIHPRDVDLLVVGSFQPDQPGVGNAAFLGRALELECPAWNLESACSTALVALQVARAAIVAGDARRVLVAISCSYSRDTDPDDTLGWFMGDAAGAFIVGPAAPGDGVLGQVVVETRATCDTFYYAHVGVEGGGRLRLRCHPETQRILRETSAAYVRAACGGAAEKAGLRIDEIDFFVFNTPTAWFAPFARAVLGIPEEKTVDTHARFGNIGPALMPVNLYEAAASGRLRADSTVCVYTIGSVSTASAAVLRWGDVRLGDAPSCDPSRA